MTDYRIQQCETMLAQLKRVGQGGMTRLEFAKLLGIKKGTHLNSLIAELMDRNLATVNKNAIDQHGRRTFVYFTPNLFIPEEYLK